MATLAETTIRRMADTNSRGLGPTYHTQQSNYCPGCGRSNWYIGRQYAECAFCSTALPLDAESSSPIFI